MAGCQAPPVNAHNSPWHFARRAVDSRKKVQLGGWAANSKFEIRNPKLPGGDQPRYSAIAWAAWREAPGPPRWAHTSASPAR